MAASSSAPGVVALCIRANDIVADFVNAAKSGVKPGRRPTATIERAQFDALTTGQAVEAAAGKSAEVARRPKMSSTSISRPSRSTSRR